MIEFEAFPSYANIKFLSAKYVYHIKMSNKSYLEVILNRRVLDISQQKQTSCTVLSRNMLEDFAKILDVKLKQKHSSLKRSFEDKDKLHASEMLAYCTRKEPRRMLFQAYR